MKGYYVWCFQKVTPNMEIPFKAKIETDNGTHWRLKYKGKIYQALKAACSTVPFKNDKEAGSEEYRQKVSKVAKIGNDDSNIEKPSKTATKQGKTRSKQRNTAKVETPGGNVPVRPTKGRSVRHVRSGDGEDQKPPGRVRKPASGGQRSRFSRST